MSLIMKYRVTLTFEEREMLKELVSTGKAAARKITHARVLLLADENSTAIKYTDESIANFLQIGVSTVARVRRRFVAHDLESALNRQDHVRRMTKKLDGEAEAFLVATVCSAAPEGRRSWTMKLLADHLVTNEIVDSISSEAVRQTLKKTHLNLG